MKVNYEIENEKMVKVITYDNGRVSKYDENGNEIYCKLDSGFQIWYEYDSKGNLIYRKESTGWQEWYEYDSNGNKIHIRDCMGNEWFAENYEARKVC